MKSPFGQFDEDALAAFNEAMAERYDFASKKDTNLEPTLGSRSRTEPATRRTR